MVRRHHWTLPEIDALPDGVAEELVLAHAGWDEMVAWAREREARRHAPKRDHSRGRPMYGMPGHYVPESHGV